MSGIFITAWFLISGSVTPYKLVGFIFIYFSAFTFALWVVGFLADMFTRIRLESGLRSYNLFKPFPEEIVRLLTFRLADIYMCPNQTAVNNLKNYSGIKINTQLNTQYDAVSLALNQKQSSVIKKPYVIVSIHRFEHIFNQNKLGQILAIVQDVAKKFQVVFVLHPATKKQLAKLNLLNQLQQNKNIHLTDRFSFFEFIKVVNESEFIITDGGSNQEEAYYLGKPTLILRDVTERHEGIGSTAVLAKFDPEIIADFIQNNRKFTKPQIKARVSPSKIIVDWIESHL